METGKRTEILEVVVEMWCGTATRQSRFGSVQPKRHRPFQGMENIWGSCQRETIEQGEKKVASPGDIHSCADIIFCLTRCQKCEIILPRSLFRRVQGMQTENAGSLSRWIFKLSIYRAYSPCLFKI